MCIRDSSSTPSRKMLDSTCANQAVKNDALKTALVSLQRRLNVAEEQAASSEKERALLRHELSIQKGELARSRTELSASLDRSRLLEGGESLRVQNLQTEALSLQQVCPPSQQF